MSGTFKKRPKPPTYPINYTPSVATERYIEEVETFFDGLAKQLREQIDHAKKEESNMNNSPHYRRWLRGYIKAKEEDLEALEALEK